LEEEKVREEPGFDKLVESSSKPNWLGNYNVVSNLLRNFIRDVFSRGFHEDNLESRARDTARILIGMDHDYPGPPWYSAQQIVPYIANLEGIQSDDPIEVITGALLNMVGDILTNVQSGEGTTQEEVKGVVEEYTYKFMGIVSAQDK
jgi:hypothetical protein